MSPKPTSQQDFLRHAKRELELEWDALAVRAGISPRALKCYRMPDTSSNHRTMPMLAWRAIEAVLREPRSAADAPMPQQAFLELALERLQVTLPELAELIGTRPLTAKNWTRADGLPSHRGMPSLARAAIERLLQACEAEKPAVTAARRSRQSAQNNSTAPRAKKPK